MKAHALLGVAMLASACAPSGTRPHDMSTAGHERAAQHEEQLATAAETPDAGCAAPPCWTVTPEARAEAERHRDLAARHRAAASALQGAEDRACGGLDEASRDESPFMHRADIASVEELTEEYQIGHSTMHRRVGATVTFRAVPGMTREWLQRVIDCHIARNAAMGHDVPEMPDCPLVPMGVTAVVRSVGGAFAVDIHAPPGDAADEVLRRARSLVTSPGP